MRKWIAALALGSGAAAVAIGGEDPSHRLPVAAAFVAIIAPFACLALPSSIIEDKNSGFTRLIESQSLPTWSYRMGRTLMMTGLVTAIVLPLIAAACLITSRFDLLAPAILALVLASLWSTALAVNVGRAFAGSTTATFLWMILASANFLAVLATWRGMDMTDIVVRARHVLPGPGVVEVLVPTIDPWLFSSALLSVAQATIALIATLLPVRGSTSLGICLLFGALLVFILPSGGQR